MTTLIDFKSVEKDILVDILNEYLNNGIHLLDTLNVSNIIENFIYENVEEYHENGALRYKYTLRFGEKEGLCQRWLDNGQIMQKFHYNNGKKEGSYQGWFENGKK